ncbi:hypothetical protein E4U55_002730 [Claviceps digitariae]|nr:hypothetical protein E4U55_002730 [Claviceps digitariae]
MTHNNSPPPDLVDEIEAINSIYGPDTLTPCPDGPCPPWTYILRLPVEEASPDAHATPSAGDDDAGAGTSLRIAFPGGYPSRGPAVLGTHHARGGVRGAGAGDLQLFRGVLGEVFREGCVCVFDGVEEFRRRRGVAMQQMGGDESEDEEGNENEDDDEGENEDESKNDNESESQPRWTLSDVVVENKSTFVARVARVSTPEQARRHVGDLIAGDKKVRGATHNITAWRIRTGTGLQFQDCDDDGETAAGARLLHLMQVMDVWGVVVVVSRWFGGVKLGPRRFAVINGVARDGLVRAGCVEGGGRERRRK